MMTTATIASVPGTMSKFELQYAIQGLSSRGCITKDRTSVLLRNLEEVKPNNFDGLARVFLDIIIMMTPLDKATMDLESDAEHICCKTLYGSVERTTNIAKALSAFNNSY